MNNLEPLLFNLYSILYLLDVFLRTKECCSEVLFKKKKWQGVLASCDFSQTTQDPPFRVKYGVHTYGCSVGGWDPEKGEKQVSVGRTKRQWTLPSLEVFYNLFGSSLILLLKKCSLVGWLLRLEFLGGITWELPCDLVF